MELSENFGVGRGRNRRSSRRSPPVHDGVESLSEALVILLRSCDPSLDKSSRSVDSRVEHVTSEFGRKCCGVVRFRDEESVPDPFTEFKTDAVEKVVRDPVACTYLEISSEVR